MWLGVGWVLHDPSRVLGLSLHKSWRTLDYSPLQNQRLFNPHTLSTDAKRVVATAAAVESLCHRRFRVVTESWKLAWLRRSRPWRIEAWGAVEVGRIPRRSCDQTRIRGSPSTGPTTAIIRGDDPLILLILLYTSSSTCWAHAHYSPQLVELWSFSEFMHIILHNLLSYDLLWAHTCDI
jgi:hypothetical protein